MVRKVMRATARRDAQTSPPFSEVAVFDRGPGVRVIVRVSHLDRLIDVRLQRQRRPLTRWRFLPGGARISLDELATVLAALTMVPVSTPPTEPGAPVIHHGPPESAS